ncbi:dihydrolipoyl dehydrogenase [Wenzhouxiangella sediminis]|uniref:Dihydrolipoyl dehydrogenase n=1 Tax=Wenzhouxiangella sediminis TaxID=1792836 RepID=A0A3E1K9B9_9GAMM|nr:dihydrolipoyl dehydrogenase [Wenzhouxiangella sediminis]RFF30702.1 dihydrolipoyl dehydrogenase [Wenzhouxiangella sediminis]
MSNRQEIKVPDIGDFDKVPVIEVLVAEGDELEAEQSLITLESDKATMEVPSPAAGKLVELKVSEGDEVGEGDVIGVLEVSEESGEDSAEGGSDHEEERGSGFSVQGSGESSDDAGEAEEPAGSGEGDEGRPETRNLKPETSSDPTDHDHEYDLAVLGSGPAGYTAAFRAADLGLKVALIERYDSIGGVCLNVGCIPSKALLHVGQVIDSAAHLGEHGVSFGEPDIDIDKLRGFKDSVVEKLTGGLAGMARKRKVEIVQGMGQFSGEHELVVEHEGSERTVGFNQCIIAAGSRVIEIPNVPWDDDRVMDSTGALELADVPERLLVIGGGIIGLEMACVYRALGSKVTVVEMMKQLMPGADADLVKPLQQHLKKQGVEFHLDTKVEKVEAGDSALTAHLDGKDAPDSADFDRVLVCVGRRPNGDQLNAEAAGVEVDDKGFIAVDGQMRTNRGHIFAIGDIVGQPMLAHKGSYEGKVAAEVAAGHKRAADARVIPSVAYTDPEVAWVGLTEGQAKDQGIDYGVGKFPWAASGRALGMDRSEGFTKLIFEKGSDRLIGAGVVGMHAGDLIAELALAIEMGCDAADIGLTIHPHPTLSESVMMAAEAYEGTITDLYMPKKG